MAEVPEAPQIIAAQKTSEADQSWIKHQREVRQKRPERIEDTAKFIPRWASPFFFTPAQFHQKIAIIAIK